MCLPSVALLLLVSVFPKHKHSCVFSPLSPPPHYLQTTHTLSPSFAKSRTDSLAAAAAAAAAID